MSDTPVADAIPRVPQRPMRDMAIPTLPARDMNETLAFYDRLGFRLRNRYGEFGGVYTIVVRGDHELPIFEYADSAQRTRFAGIERPV